VPDSRKNIFISHSEVEAAGHLQRILLSAFSDHVNLFNSADASQGLGSGLRIEDAILECIDQAVLFISLWTPHSIAKPEWMSWELGAARAREKPILVGRALGVEVRALPLSLSARVANDLGDPSQVLRFVKDASETLACDIDDGFKAYLDELVPAPFHERKAGSTKLKVSVHGRYLLVENVSDQDLRDVRAVGRKQDPESSPALWALDRTFVAHERRLSAGGRLVAALPGDSVLVGVTHDPETDVSAAEIDRHGNAAVKLQWISPVAGREWNIVTVFEEETQ